MDLQKEHNQYKIKIQNNLHFPIDSFPETTRYFIREIASSIGVDDSFPGTIILSVVSGLIGSSVKITVKDGYSEIAPIWTILISPSGNAKTPVFNTVLNPVEIIQSELDRKYDERFKKYSHKCILYDEKLRLWKKDFRNEIESEMPEEPSKPFRKRLLLNDASLCSIIESLENYPEGSLLYQDELSGLLNSFKNSSNGRDNLPKYLSLFNGEVTRYARKGKEDLIIPRPTFTLTGTIQPKVLHEITRKNKRLENSGMLQRFLYCYSTSNPMRWTDKTISIDVKKEFEKMTRTIFDLRDHATRMNAPLELSLSPEAYKEWVEFCNLNAEKQEDTANDFVRSSLAKFQTHTARIALTLHVLKCVETKKDYSEWSLQVDSETMLDAIRLIDWFGGELHKVGSLLHGNSSSEDDLTELILEKISESTEGMKVRDLQRSTHRFKGERKAEELDRKLCEMVRNGMLSRQIQKAKNGRAVEIFFLPPDIDSDDVDEESTENSCDFNDNLPVNDSPPVDTMAENAVKNGINVAESLNNTANSIHHAGSDESCRETSEKPNPVMDNTSGRSSGQNRHPWQEEAILYVASLPESRFWIIYKLFLGKPLPPGYKVPDWFKKYDPSKKIAIIEQLLTRYKQITSKQITPPDPEPSNFH